VDNDGDPDLYLSARGPDVLLMNDGGLFSPKELPSVGLGSGSAWGDYDADGVLDLYVINYWCGDCDWLADDAIEQSRDFLLVQDSALTLVDASHLLTDQELAGFGFAASWADYDNDGDQDLMVVNDKGTVGPPTPGWTVNRNLYWRNDGPGCGGHCFTEVGQDIGADLRLDSMCLASADYDNDGDLDTFMTDTGQPALLQNFGGSFVDVTLAAGITQSFEGWGCVFFDYDNDGWLDLVAAGGFTDDDWLWHNNGDGTFTAVEDWGASDTVHNLGVAAADYDYDGAVDLLLGTYDGPYRLARNMAPDPSFNWLGLRLVGSGAGGIDAVGARVTIEDDSGRTQMREIVIGASLGSGSDTGLHFGFGDAVPVSATIRWLDGSVQLIDPPLNTWSEVVYGP
jgi:enediyne biosynthesis protein E4